ncbi:hypothetical protein TNCV_906221 [Trichonephila clavipes]|nr:hypothetical protein TNCV_906221 [Trichonephila clavipes]
MYRQKVGHWCCMFNGGRQNRDNEDRNGCPSGSMNENDIAAVLDMMYLNHVEAYKFTSEEKIFTKQC